MNQVLAAATAQDSDPLLASVPLPYSVEVFPCGFPAVVHSNSPAVVAAAEQSWDSLRKTFDENPLEIRLLTSGTRAEKCPPPPVFRAQKNLLVAVADAENFLCCDLVRGFASGWVTETVAEDAEYLRYHFIESMAYCMLNALHVVSVHAACVSLDGHGILLVGDSGAGKSSLAYACARRGWTHVSDDSSSLVRRARGRTVIGNPGVFRFRKTAPDLFPELRGFKDHRRANGKATIEVRSEFLPAVRTAREAEIEYVVFLCRHDGNPRRVELVPVGEEEAQRRLFACPWPEDLATFSDQRAVLKRLLSVPVYDFHYRDLEEGVSRLERLVRGGA
jgi:hypothetical protein